MKCFLLVALLAVVALFTELIYAGCLPDRAVLTPCSGGLCSRPGRTIESCRKNAETCRWLGNDQPGVNRWCIQKVRKIIKMFK